jgi:hypothetical protein
MMIALNNDTIQTQHYNTLCASAIACRCCVAVACSQERLSFAKFKLQPEIEPEQGKQHTDTQTKREIATMADDHACKRAAAVTVQSNPFYEVGILQTVMSCAGTDQWFFLAPVCKLWRDLYAQLSASIDVRSTSGRRRIITCHKIYRSAFASPLRVKLACESGLTFTTEKGMHAAGAYADTATLATAHELGMMYSATTMAAAARYNKLAVLQFLHAEAAPGAQPL